jgi:hypothetical protein
MFAAWRLCSSMEKGSLVRRSIQVRLEGSGPNVLSAATFGESD